MPKYINMDGNFLKYFQDNFLNNIKNIEKVIDIFLVLWYYIVIIEEGRGYVAIE